MTIHVIITPRHCGNKANCVYLTPTERNYVYLNCADTGCALAC